jgi:hypothetical protein
VACMGWQLTPILQRWGFGLKPPAWLNLHYGAICRGFEIKPTYNPHPSYLGQSYAFGGVYVGSSCFGGNSHARGGSEEGKDDPI